MMMYIVNQITGLSKASHTIYLPTLFTIVGVRNKKKKKKQKTNKKTHNLSYFHPVPAPFPIKLGFHRFYTCANIEPSLF